MPEDRLAMAARRIGGVWVSALLGGVLALAASCRPAEGTVHAAVAANFTEPGRQIARLFEQETGHRVVLSFGSTGQLFAQISQDAPFEVFLAADQRTPGNAVDAGLGDGESLFTYAVGEIVLYSTTLDLTRGEDVLNEGSFERIAIANPATAPYGAAALEAMRSLGVAARLREKTVEGNNIAQTFQFVETGNAELGFVARSQVVGKADSSIWVVPGSHYEPVRQDAVLLRRGAGNAAARAFLAFLRSPEAVEAIESYGYRTLP